MVSTVANTRRILIASILCAFAAQAQETTSPAPAPLSSTDIDARISRVESDTTLDAAVKSRITDTYRQALSELRTADEWRAQTAEWIASRESAPERVREIEVRLSADTVSTPPAEEWADRSLDDLVQEAGSAESRLSAARSELNSLQAEASSRVERRRQLPDLISAARERLATAQSAPPPATDASTEDAEAQRIANRARIEALTAEVDALSAESTSYEARGRLLPLRLDLANRELRAAEAYARIMQEILSARRQAEAERAAEDARRLLLEALDAPASVRERAEELAQQNEDLAAMRTGLDGMLQRIEQVRQQTSGIRSESARIIAERENVVKREKAVGLNNAVGQLLRTYRASLPASRPHTVAVRLREETIGEAQIEQIEVEERRRELSDVSQQVEEILSVAGFASDVEPRQTQELSRLMTELLSTQRANLDALWADYDTYITALVEQNGAERDFIQARNEFADYIDQRVLWIRSGTIISGDDLREGLDALLWLISPETWSVAIDALMTDARAHPLVNAVALIFAGLALFVHPRIQRRLASLGDRAEKRSTVSYRLTIEALAYTLWLSIWIPAIITFIAWRMSVSLVGGEFVNVLSAGLIVVAAFYASFEFPRLVMSPKGLGICHFDWPEESARFAKNTIGWMMPVALPIILLIALFESQEQQEWRESVGRLAFFIMMVVWAYLGHRFANRRSPALALFEVITTAGERSSVRRALYALAAGAPMALAASAALGYYYTSVRLAWRIHATLIFLFLVAVSVNLAMRALLIARRRLAIEQAKRKRDEMKAAERKAQEEGGDVVPVIESQDPEYDLTRIDAQTSRLIRSLGVITLFLGLWFTWNDFLPALRVLDDVELISYGKQLDDLAGLTGAGSGATSGTVATEPSGEPAKTSTVLRERALTLGDLLTAVVVVALTVVAFRNLPGLVEIALLQRLPLAPGERYAIKTVLGYALALFGTVFALSTLGIRWGSVQWLVAALGFGIGFGLQEIIANFISGLIILFERPIRVGDTVTISDMSGTVTRIRIRATTITDWDMKEILIPNKEFVTGRVVNWSLTNPTLRIVVPVGVAYGTDTRLVQETLQHTAEKNKRVLRQPPPQVCFVGFGDSAMLFETRVYVASIEDLLPVKDDLHHAIAGAFRAKGIEIAFPHQDIHIRSIAPVTVQGERIPAELEHQ